MSNPTPPGQYIRPERRCAFRDLDTAKAEFGGAWTALKVRASPEQLAAAYRDLNIRDGG